MKNVIRRYLSLNANIPSKTEKGNGLQRNILDDVQVLVAHLPIHFVQQSLTETFFLTNQNLSWIQLEYNALAGAASKKLRINVNILFYCSDSSTYGGHCGLGMALVPR